MDLTKVHTWSKDAYLNGSLDDIFNVSSSERYFRTANMAVISVFGTFGNLIIFLSAMPNNNLVSYHYLVLNMVFVDMIVSGFCHLVQVYTNFYGTWPLDEFLCSSSAVLRDMCYAISNLTALAIALNRTVACRVLYNPTARKFLSKKAVLVYIILIWLTAFSMTGLLVILDVMDVGFNEISDMCQARSNHELTFLMTLSSLCIYAPLVVCFCCYLYIFVILRRSQSTFKIKLLRARYIKTTKKMALLFILQFLSWIPMAVNSIVAVIYGSHRFVFHVVYFIWICNTGINPFIYAFINLKY